MAERVGVKRSAPGEGALLFTNIAVISDYRIPSYYVRVHDPLVSLGAQFKTRFSDQNGGDLDQFIQSADLLIVQRTVNRRAWGAVQYAQRSSIPIIYEVDDNFFDLSPASPTRLPAEIRGWTRDTAAIAQLVMTSTRNLADALRPINPNTIVNLNYSLPLPRTPRQKQPHLCIVNTDYFKLTETAADFFRSLTAAVRYHGYRVTFYGSVSPSVKKFVSDERDRAQLIEIFEPDREKFLRFLSTEGVNVAAVPLEMSKPHSYKSDIKFLDFASIGVPGVFNNRDVYWDVAHRTTGFITESSTYSGWMEGLTFFQSEAVRESVGMVAKSYADRSRSVSNNVETWRQILTGPLV